jgi:PST family polysaccharide transporter
MSSEASNTLATAVVIPSPAAVAQEATGQTRTLSHAVAWTGLGRWTTQLLTWASTIIVARILAPSDYGLFGMATIYTGLVAVISEFGLGQAIVTIREMSGAQVAQINALSITAGCLLFGLSCAAAHPLGRFFNSPKLPSLIVVMSIAFLMSGMQVVPDALLQSNLRFKLLASFDIARALTQSLTTVALALLGFGYWSLGFGTVAGAFVAAAAALIARPHSLAWPRFSRIKHALRFSSDVLGSRVAWYAYSNSDFLVAGRMLGPASLGSYTIAWTVAATPVEKITNMLSRVTPAFFSAVHHDKHRMRRYLLGITDGLSMLTFPASIGMALVADQFVLVFLGPKWLAVVMPLRLLALCAAMRSITTVFPNMLFAMRDSRFVMWNTVISAIVFCTGFYFSSRWGITAIALTWLVLYPVITAPYVWRTLTAIELPVWEYFRSMFPAIRASLCMVMAIAGTRALTSPTLPPVLRLLVLIATGILAYAATLWFVDRQHVREIYTRLRRGEI